MKCGELLALVSGYLDDVRTVEDRVAFRGHLKLRRRSRTPA
jgi:hypothetical protein